MTKINPANCAILFAALSFTSCKNETASEPVTAQASIAPKFELLDPAVSGIQFQNTIKEDFRNNIVTNVYLYNGGGVAVADFNNDGLQDLYFTATQGSCRLYVNKGNLTFDDITETSGASASQGYKTGVTAVDINQDGWMDLYVCRTGLQAIEERRNLLFVNNGNLTFTERAAEFGLDDMSASNHANFFDADKDGDLDMYLLNHPVDFENVNRVAVEIKDGKEVLVVSPKSPYDSDRFYRNEGNGKFSDRSEQAGIVNRAWGLSVTISDFNEDGYPDLFVGNDYNEPDYLYINNQNGTFTDQNARYFRHLSNHTMGVDIADINNDTKIDLVALDMIAEDNRRQKNLATNMTLDRYMTMVRYGYGHQIMRNVLQVNMGEGGFIETGCFSSVSNTDWSWAPLLADFDNDSQKDLFITNGYRRDVTNLDYMNYTLDSLSRTGGVSQQRFPYFEDFLKLIPSEPLQNYMFRNKGELSFEKVSDAWGFTQKTYSNGAAYADLDNDGDLDLVINNLEQPATVYKNTTREKEQTAYLQIRLEGTSPNLNGIGAKLRLMTDDGQMQWIEMTPTRGFFSSVEYLLHFGLGHSTSVAALEVEWPNGKYQKLTNVPANQRLTLKISEAAPGKITAIKKEVVPPIFSKVPDNLGADFTHVENDFIDFKREFLIPHKLSNLGPFIAVADVNGDRFEDFFIGGAANSPGALFVQNGKGQFSKKTGQPWEADAFYEDLESLFFDADGDGDPDLYVVSGDNASLPNSPNYQDRLYLNDGKGIFTKAANALPEIRSSGSCVEAFDFDGDGDLDLFVGGRVSPNAYPTAPRSFVLVNDKGQFRDVTNTVAPAFAEIGMVTDLKWADLDGDGVAEMVVVGEWMPVTVFKLENGKLKLATESFGLAQTNGWWNCLSIEDIDNDGDSDLIAGNLGLNSRFKTSTDKPLTIYAKDFDDNGQIDPIITWYDGALQYPLPTRDMIIKQIAGLKKKFLRYETYAVATIDEVFSKSDLKNALKLEAKTFHTSCFENQGNGKFKPIQLPTPAQLSPVYQIICRDFNGDGQKDLLLAGNNYGTEVETGRLDAGNGTLLLRESNGQFRTMSNASSGFWASKEVRDLKIIRLVGEKEALLIANNSDRLEVFTFDQKMTAPLQ